MSGTRRQDDEGAAAVEFGLLLIPLLIIITGLIEFGLIFNAQISITHAAHEGARLSAVSPTANIAARVIQTAAPTVSLTPADVSILSCGDVAVSFSYPTPLFGLIGLSQVTVKGQGVEQCYAP